MNLVLAYENQFFFIYLKFKWLLLQVMDYIIIIIMDILFYLYKNIDTNINFNDIGFMSAFKHLLNVSRVMKKRNIHDTNKRNAIVIAVISLRFIIII